MDRLKAVITGVGGYVPDYVLSNKELEKMVDTNDEWIRTRTGISERRILKGNKGASFMAVKAIERMFEKTGTDPKDIDVVICATVSGDTPMPDTGTTILTKIGATNAFGFDLGAACSGFLYALTTGASFIESGNYKKVLVVGVDVMSSIINYEDRSTCVIFGDGAGCVLLEPSENGEGIHDSFLRGDSKGREFLYISAGGSLRPTTVETATKGEQFVVQEGKAVFKTAVLGMADAVKTVMEKNDLDASEIAWIVPHQANIRIIKSVADQLDFPMDRVMVNIHKYGNTTAATLPLCLFEYQPQIKKGDKLILTAFGGGYTWGATYLTWGLD